MSVRADLHIHTTASDGTWTPAELIAEAQKQQLGLIAVTDHDSVANVAEAMTLAAAAGITVLPAAEICSTKEDLSFHILGYGIDIHNKQLLELMQHNEALLEQKDVDSIHLLARDGWPVDEAEFTRYTYDRRRGGWRALAYLIDKGLCTGVGDFFKRIFTHCKKHGLLISGGSDCHGTFVPGRLLGQPFITADMLRLDGLLPQEIK